MANRINLAFLWHMHQPNYVDPVKKEFIMPWVRLHAMQDYYDIPKTIMKVKGAKSNINFVPSLLEQLDFYIQRRYTDSYLAVVEKNADILTDFEKNFIVDKLFNINLEKVVFKSPRYKELFLKKDKLLNTKKYNIGTEFFEQELRDLQVHFQLGWSGTELKKDPFISELIKKDRDFTEDEKKKLLDIQYDFLKKVKNFIKDLAYSEGIEVSVTPFYHPIIPIMNDINNVILSWKDSIVPNNFSNMSYYSELHIKKSLEFSKNFFGKIIKGMWPAEGSVSNDFLRQINKTEINWIATDQEILNKSKGYAVSLDELCKPYRYDGINIFFRNHALSDKIGFVYSNWDKYDAVNDFVNELLRLKDSITVENPLITVILDGENAWEYYEEHGEPFLEELFSRLVEEEGINLVTFNEYLENENNIPELDNLIPGSWIDGNFNTWINEPVKNKYWEYLFHLNGIIEDKKKNNEISNEVLREVERYFLIAQGSDWMWWAGEGHSSANDLDFDLLFRNYLIRIYETLSIEIPLELYSPLYNKQERITYKKPLHFIYPKISGKLDDYYGWVSSGEILPEQGAIHKTEVVIGKVLFGFDDKNMYFQIRFAIDSDLFKKENYEIIVDFVNFSKKIELNGKNKDIKAYTDEICEAAIPFKVIDENIKSGDLIKFRVLLTKDGKIVERVPNTEVITLNYPNEDFDFINWSV